MMQLQVGVSHQLLAEPLLTVMIRVGEHQALL